MSALLCYMYFTFITFIFFDNLETDILFLTEESYSEIILLKFS